MHSDNFDIKAAFLTVLANSHRLHIIKLLGHGEMAVGAIATTVGLSQSALSQHLAKMRRSGVLKTRRDAQTVYYSVKSENARTILKTLERMFDGGQTVSLRAVT